ncbi:MAG: type II toxin-antitoxin system HipA family toxin [Candidatus Endonucleobacter bathymodioli]|uniref:Type II toxin-antitoxin system HipA family toxin n=1 Tax=Candidatus Endonucleibacter bathymodioli TaxID=539814 RepID=A0AA90SRZ0_9GAMM|nr:type II toxin-antitoxin system HipA family toxin [Candidatus Endonucleobacter bathymodioli]
MTAAQIKLWGKSIGAVSWDDSAGLAHFEYESEFINSDIEVAPFTMPLSRQIYSFAALPRETFHGLPGLIADSLPDDFGNALINVWLAKQGRSPETFNPVERLCYIGARGMGALEYQPSQGNFSNKPESVDVKALVELASKILTKRNTLEGSFAPELRENSLQEILKIGTSAGGARAKAIIGWNQKTNEVRSGQVTAGEGFTDWLLKFDGVSGNKDKELDDPAGYGLIEHAYYQMAREAKIDMEESRLLKENGRNHFMTKRFDRTASGQKIHMQSLCAMEHFDFKQAGAYSYEQALRTIRKLGMPMATIEQQFRRMAFNIIGRNQDDHVKNISFLMDKSGNWSLSPAFDMTYSYNPQGDWTNKHQMSLNGKCDHFTIDDFKVCAKNISMKRGRAEEIVRQVQKAILQWKHFADESSIPAKIANSVAKAHRTDILK